MEPIKSLSELFPDAQVVVGTSQELADEANRHINKEYPDAGEFF